LTINLTPVALYLQRRRSTADRAGHSRLRKIFDYQRPPDAAEYRSLVSNTNLFRVGRPGRTVSFSFRCSSYYRTQAIRLAMRPRDVIRMLVNLLSWWS